MSESTALLLGLPLGWLASQLCLVAYFMLSDWRQRRHRRAQRRAWEARQETPEQMIERWQREYGGAE